MGCFGVNLLSNNFLFQYIPCNCCQFVNILLVYFLIHCTHLKAILIVITALKLIFLSNSQVHKHSTWLHT